MILNRAELFTVVGRIWIILDGFHTETTVGSGDEYYFVKKMILKKIRTILSDLHF